MGGGYQEEGLEHQIQDLDEIEFGDLNIINLFGKERLEDIQLKISKATGLAFVTVDYKGEPVTKATYFTKFCQMRRDNQQDQTCCKSSDAFGAIQAAVTKKPCIYFCPCGLLEVAIPIVIDGHYLGGFIGGQVRCHNAPEEVPHLDQIIKRSEKSIDGLEEVSTYRYESFQDVANLVFMIINLLTENEINRRLEKQQLKKELKKISATQKKQKAQNIDRKIITDELEAQCNPYTLLDLLALATNYSIIENAPKTNELLMTLMDYLRYTYLNQEIMVHIKDEVQHIRHYLNMQKEKYAERLEYSIEVEEALGYEMIPNHMLLPFVQNAVFFGSALRKQEGKVEVKIYGHQGNVMIEVNDNGPGMSEEEKSARYVYYKEDYEGYGIQKAMENAEKKLQHIFKENMGVTISNQKGVGCRCKIWYPKHNKRGDEVNV